MVGLSGGLKEAAYLTLRHSHVQVGSMVNTCMYSVMSELNTEPVSRVDSQSCREYVYIASVT